MSLDRAARPWHAATALVGLFGLITQLILVIDGASVLVVEEPPSLPERLLRFLSYFTVQANAIVLISCVTLARDPARDGRHWRILRLNALVGITVTGIVHWFFLRPLLHLVGWSYVTDKLLHVVVPLMAVLGWFLFGPRPRVDWPSVWKSLIWPAAWLVYILILGALSGWYPYPFVNVDVLGAGPVGLAALGIAVGLIAVSLLLLLGDRRLRHVSPIRSESAP